MWLPGGFHASDNIGTAPSLVPELYGTVLRTRSLRSLAQNLKRLTAYQRQLLAQFDKRLQFFPFGFL